MNTYVFVKGQLKSVAAPQNAARFIQMMIRSSQQLNAIDFKVTATNNNVNLMFRGDSTHDGAIHLINNIIHVAGPRIGKIELMEDGSKKYEVIHKFGTTTIQEPEHFCYVKPYTLGEDPIFRWEDSFEVDVPIFKNGEFEKYRRKHPEFSKNDIKYFCKKIDKRNTIAKKLGIARKARIYEIAIANEVQVYEVQIEDLEFDS